MSEIDFRGRYGSAGSKEVYFARIRKGLDFEKASFAGDRSAAGRYAAQQRWKGHVKDATKPAVRERRMAEKFQEGPILKSGFDSMGFPKILTPAEAKKRFGDTVKKQVAYFASRGLELLVNDKTSDKLPTFDTESPAYFATLQALDDVLDQVDVTKLTVDPKNGSLPFVGISAYYENSGDTTGGYFDSTRNDVKLFMNVARLVEESYASGPRYVPGTVPQMAADVIQASSFAKDDSIGARIAYGFTVHEMGHWIDYSLGVTDKGFENYRSYSIVQRAKRDGRLALEAEQRFSDFSEGSSVPRGTSYSNTNYAEKFAENFTAWFTMTKVTNSTITQLKSDLANRGGYVALTAAFEVLKQGQIVDNMLNWRPDHPVFLFAFRGEPFDVDAFRQQLLVGMIKASFGGDRSAAGRYAANMRWQGQARIPGFIGKSQYKLGADGSIHPKALLTEIMDEASNSVGDSLEVRGDIPADCKRVVAKNIAIAMSDVTVSEMATVLGDLTLLPEDEVQAIEYEKITDMTSLVQEIAGSKEPRTFRVSSLGDLLTFEISQNTEDQFVEEEISRLREKNGFLYMDSLDVSPGQASDQTYEQYMRTELRRRYQYILEGSTEYTYPSSEGEQALKEVMVKTMVSTWAASSNDKVALSLAVQDAAQKVFKTDWSVSWDDDEAVKSGSYQQSTDLGNNKVLQSFVKAQYAATQQYFAAKGIKEVTLFRGVEGQQIRSEYDDADEQTEKVEFLMRPLSSWSTSPNEANFFAGSGDRDGAILKARFKVEDILSIPLTGVGCLMENEAVVKSGSVMGQMTNPFGNPRGVTSSSPEGKIKWADRQTAIDAWAYSEETGEMPTK